MGQLPPLLLLLEDFLARKLQQRQMPLLVRVDPQHFLYNLHGCLEFSGLFVTNTNTTAAAPNTGLFGATSAPAASNPPAGNAFGTATTTAAPTTGGLFGGILTKIYSVI